MLCDTTYSVMHMVCITRSRPLPRTRIYIDTIDDQAQRNGCGEATFGESLLSVSPTTLFSEGGPQN
jgi:hypothetical protein